MLKYLDKRSLKFKMWTYFILFAAIIMIVLWLLQIVFINSYYESMKANEIKKIGNSLVSKYGDEGLRPSIYTSLREGIVIQIFDERGAYYTL